MINDVCIVLIIVSFNFLRELVGSSGSQFAEGLFPDLKRQKECKTLQNLSESLIQCSHHLVIEASLLRSNKSCDLSARRTGQGNTGWK